MKSANLKQSKLVLALALGVAPLLASCGGAGASTVAATATPTPTPTPTATATPTVSPFNINSFSPASGATTIPKQVTVSFSEASTAAAVAANWSFICSGSGTPSGATATSVIMSGTTAIITLPTVVGANGTTTCTLAASNNIIDANGNLLTGIQSSTYGNSGTSTASNSYVAYWSNPDPSSSAPVAGSIKISAAIFENQGTTTPPSTVQFLINSIVIGTSTGVGSSVSTNLDTTLFPNGSYTLSMNAYDSSNNLYSDIAAPLTIEILNLDSTSRSLCSANNGVDTFVNGTVICQIPGGTCPSGLVPYGDGNWTTTVANTCSGGSTWGCGSPHHGTTGYHSTFEDLAPETVQVPTLLDCGPLTHGSATCTATITSIGCVLSN